MQLEVRGLGKLLSTQFSKFKKSSSPVAIYVAAGVYAIIGFISYFVGFMTEIPIEIYRDVFILHTFALLENCLVLGLLVVMAYTLNKKRKLAMR